MDTIVAVSTPPGRGGLAVVRISGPLVPRITPAVLSTGLLPSARRAVRAAFVDAGGDHIDHGIALYFPAPASYTGEDVLELQGHGSPVANDLLVHRVVALGARLAGPGEFTQRAFLNDKLDLSRAEAVADLIDASSVEAARGAMRSLAGALSTRAGDLTRKTIELRVHIEAGLDFPDEELDILDDPHILNGLSELSHLFEQTLDEAAQGQLLRDGIQAIILGAPNVGKSTLLNALSGQSHAIVTDLPGTTRDLVRAEINLDGLTLHLSDTAGLRDPEDEVERLGIQRARDVAAQAQIALVVIDHRQGWTQLEASTVATLPADSRVLVVQNKIDLRPEQSSSSAIGFPTVAVSAKTSEGLPTLIDLIKQAAGYAPPTEGIFLARRRHIEALLSARAALARALELVSTHHQPELVAEELRLVQQAVGELTGSFDNEALLDNIFASFCIGK